MKSAYHFAKITAGTNTTSQVGSGGMPDITREDVLGALGYCRGRVPDHAVGVHLVLARYCLDSMSYNALHQPVLEIAWMLWLKAKRPGLTSVDAMSGIAKLAVYDWCHTEQVRNASDTEVARFVGVDPKTWKKRYEAHYGTVMARLSELEYPVLQTVGRALSRREVEKN
jgi:hypothetical protein